MLEYTIQSLFRAKQQEIEKKSNEAWKYVDFKKENLYQKIVKSLKLKFYSKGFRKQNQCICEC